MTANYILEDIYMHPVLKTAIDKANEIMQEMTAGATTPTAERARLDGLSKEELIEEILVLKSKKMKDIKVEDLAYAIMCTPECSALSYGMIATIILKYRPGNTKAGNISWYASKAIEKERDIVPRVCQKELNVMLMACAE
jgi:hypothetical protein